MSHRKPLATKDTEFLFSDSFLDTGAPPSSASNRDVSSGSASQFDAALNAPLASGSDNKGNSIKSGEMDAPQSVDLLEFSRTKAGRSSSSASGFGGSLNDDSGSDDERQPLLGAAERGDALDLGLAKKRVSWPTRLWRRLLGRPDFEARTIMLGQQGKRYAPNVIRNQKYRWWYFGPVVLFEQFRFFFNLYFLAVALTQFIPVLQVGFLFTYVAPLVFVLSITISKEAYDDWNRHRRDAEINQQEYERLTSRGLETVTSAEIEVGHLIRVHCSQRVPADMLLLRTTNKNGASFIKTDQLDGETDWKLRHAIGLTQRLQIDEQLLEVNARVFAGDPIKDIYKFEGVFDAGGAVESLSLDNTLWSNTVVASGTVIGLVVYTGAETRAAMNTSTAATKVGLIDLELNNLSKVLFGTLVLLSLAMIAGKGFTGIWEIYFFRYVLLFSSIIPISLRVNLDMAKTLFSILIMRDQNIPNTVVRTSTIPEELGRITYLLSDKTGTLTQNDMIFKKLHLGRVAFGKDAAFEVGDHLVQAYEQSRARRRTESLLSESPEAPIDGVEKMSVMRESEKKKIRRTIHSRVLDAILALAICHNVTPTGHDDEEEEEEEEERLEVNLVSKSERERKREQERESARGSESSGGGKVGIGRSILQTSKKGLARLRKLPTNPLGGSDSAAAGDAAVAEESKYQASSPDEIALVKFSEAVGLQLYKRDFKTMTLKNPLGHLEHFEVLNIFPFSSARKRMGIIVRCQRTKEITFYLKGADNVMSKMVKYNDWLLEECDNMAREGLRTLVFAKRTLSESDYEQWATQYHRAKTALRNRDAQVDAVVSTLECDLDLLGLTGVEDKLQHNVRGTLETLRNASIRIWMLTGDKIETATCIAISAKLVSRNQTIFPMVVSQKHEAEEALNTFAQQRDACLVIDGTSLQFCLDHFPERFMDLACAAPSVVCCRCSPTQKADIVRLIKKHTGKQTCAIGDGGNDVSMIQAADVGVGIVGKEGRQASLASDFSVTQFSFICRLILWHGRNSYNRSARLGQFILHRGLIISFLQAAFSACYNWAAISIFNGYLLVGYATIFTALPVFALIWDVDVSEELCFQFPELYWDLQKGRSLSFKTFFTWLLISIYQGCSIMLLCVYLQEDDWQRIVAITFCALIFTELINAVFEIHRWNRVMISAQVVTLLIYLTTIVVLRDTFELSYMITGVFFAKTALVTAVSCVPVYAGKVIRRRVSPPVHEKIKA